MKKILSVAVKTKDFLDILEINQKLYNHDPALSMVFVKDKDYLSFYTSNSRKKGLTVKHFLKIEWCKSKCEELYPYFDQTGDTLFLRNCLKAFLENEIEEAILNFYDTNFFQLVDHMKYYTFTIKHLFIFDEKTEKIFKQTPDFKFIPEYKYISQEDQNIMVSCTKSGVVKINNLEVKNSKILPKKYIKIKIPKYLYNVLIEEDFVEVKKIDKFVYLQTANKIYKIDKKVR